MSAQVTISQLPAAGAITGTELVPVVQNGVTVQTTTAALAGSPVQTQTFLTKNQEPTLTNSRALSSGTGVGLVDGGAQSTLTITLNAASGSLESASTGMIAKTASNTVAARTMSSTTTGLSVSNGDGVAGNPTFALTGVALAVAGATGTGALALTSSSTVSTRTILGTTSQIDVTDGNFVNSPVIAISADPVLSGSGGLVIPSGTTGQRGSSTNGNIRYNSTTGLFEGYNGSWTSFAAGSGVTSIATGTGLTGGPITSTGTISLADTAVVPASYTFSSITVDQQGRITAASSGTVPTGTVTSVAQSFTGGLITVSGSPVTTSGTLALSVAGTSGGIPYFSSSSIWASSAALTQYGVVYGGGAGGTPVATAAGTTGQVLTATTSGAPSWASPATSGTVTSVSWTGGIVSIANPTSAPAFTIAGTSGGIPYFSSGTTWATSTALAANALVIGGGAGAAPSTTTTGTGVLTFLGTPSSANLAAAVTDETGSGSLVFSASPTFTGTLAAAAITASTTLGVTGVSTLTGGAVIQGLTVGKGANAVATNTAVGVGALASGSLSGASNVAVGSGALAANTINGNNTAVGANSLITNTSGYSNTAVGSAALSANISGGQNVALGVSALTANTGNNNIAIGYNAGTSLTTGSNNTIIGSVAGTAGLSDTVIIAAGSAERMRIDSSGNVRIGASGASTYLFNAVDTTAATATAIVGEFVSTAVLTGESTSWVKVEKDANYGGAIGGYLTQGVGGGLLLGTQNGSATPTERMRIDSTGLMKVPGGISGGTF